MPESWPDLAVLELLVAVPEFGGLGAAARAVGMAQPNASRSIARLERELGIALIERSARGSTMTAEGKVVVQWARNVLDAAVQLVDGAGSLRAEHRAQLTVAASMTVAEYLVPGWLGELRRVSPEIKIKLDVHNSRDVFAAVRSGACDVGFVESPSVPSGLHSTVVGHDRLLVVADPGHPWARRRRPLTAGELAATPLVVREPGSGTRVTLEDALRGHDVAAPALELTSNAAVRIAASAGVAPAALSKLAVDAALRTGELKAIAVDGLDLGRRLRAVWRSPRRLSGPAADLIAIVTHVEPPRRSSSLP